MARSRIFLLYLTGSLTLILILTAACSTSPALSVPDTPTPFPPATVTAIPPSLEPTLTPTLPDAPAATATAANAVDFPDPSGFLWKEVATGLNRPIGVVSAGDGSGRLFIIEQPGRILIHNGENVLNTPFLDIRGRVRNSGSEQGLLGLAFHPSFQENGYFYINYTDRNGNTVVSRFQISTNPDQGNPDSESIVIQISQPFQNHNGGQLLFGPDGYLWIATGDGGGGGDPQENAQAVDNLLGKLLRIDVSQTPYTIPADNPFGNEIWAYGLRNPWRFTFDPLNGDLYIADVGQKLWEEINHLPASAPPGANFGWDYLEGSHPYEGSLPEDLQVINPVWEYDHALGCSISGGAVYRGSLPEWQGIYLYSDFCSGTIWGLLRTSAGDWKNQDLFQADGRIAALDQDENGEVYLVEISGTKPRLIKK